MINPITSYYKHEGLKIMLTTQGHTLDQVLEAFECVLRGNSFHFNGTLDIVDDQHGNADGLTDARR